MRVPWLLIVAFWLTGCASVSREVTKSVSFTIEVRDRATGRLQWRKTITSEGGTEDPPGWDEKVPR